MNKLTLEIYLPAARQSFDVQVRPNAPLHQVTALTAKNLSTLADGLYSPEGDPVLCDRATGQLLNVNMTVWDLGLRNGSRLMLM